MTTGTKTISLAEFVDFGNLAHAAANHQGSFPECELNICDRHHGMAFIADEVAPDLVPNPEPEDTNAREQARAQMSSIAGMVERLNHAQDQESPCWNSYDDGGPDAEFPCDISDADMLDNSGWYGGSGDQPTQEQWEKYHDEDDARQYLEGDALSVQVRDTQWKSPGQAEYGPDQFEILLCTGGPAVRILGELDHGDEPSRCRLEYQDWGTPWTEYHGDNFNAATLLEYARVFYFGA